MKTVKQWFETLPQPYSQQAIDNTSPYQLTLEYDDIKTALLSAFVWEHTLQGHDYWNKLQESL